MMTRLASSLSLILVAAAACSDGGSDTRGASASGSASGQITSASEALGGPLEERHGPLDAVVADARKHGVERHHQPLEALIEALEEAGMANGEAPDGIHDGVAPSAVPDAATLGG